MSLRTLVPRSIAVAWGATIAVAFVVSLLFSLVAGFRGNSPVQWQDMAMAPIFALMAAAVSAYVSFGIALFGGIPIFYVMRRRGLTSVRAYLVAGALLSIISLALLFAAYQFKIFLYGQPSLVRIAVSIASVAGPVAALTMRRFDESVEARSTGSKRTRD
jgi:hypothetical protein